MFSIRPARPSDQGSLYRICLETADSGADATHIYRDPLLVGHIYAGPYLAHAPAFAFVLEDETGVCGYVIGTLNTREFEATLEREWWPELRSQYDDPSEIPAAKRSPDEKLTRLIHHPTTAPQDILEACPSHLHIDLLPRGQGGGNGRQMLERLFAALREAGSPGVHLGVGSRNTRAIGFYRHLGFQELSRDAGGLLLGLKL
ncbi:GNAT family N-acetyltransferase [Deinococcus arenicola]|uniref:GNAT family N-acetyltransferase n=1 Tax=Deinococcus arenicola TaxID=2994950 RepID=A0ABU4DP18_9DEIO|nr:GNAT family N-acetyltransferase [Deinococcus sp. ZS9-10]MDV6374113.1 GNAT family N-acetyltransferase [Deinococcus sp. ZS9-10]